MTLSDSLSSCLEIVTSLTTFMKVSNHSLSLQSSRFISKSNFDDENNYSLSKHTSNKNFRTRKIVNRAKPRTAMTFSVSVRHIRFTLFWKMTSKAAVFATGTSSAMVVTSEIWKIFVTSFQRKLWLYTGNLYHFIFTLKRLWSKGELIKNPEKVMKQK